jgi:hypothetical protein
MACCDLQPNCYFYNDTLSHLPQRAYFFRDKYCNGDFSECARYIIFKAYGHDKVPRYLCPNDICTNHRRYI